MELRLAAPEGSAERRLAVIDMGSNTFRLVVFRYRTGGSFQLVDEIRDAVRLSAGAGPAGLHPDSLERAAHTARLYAAFVEAAGIDDVAAVTTSAARDAANRDDVMEALTAGGRLDVRVLSAEEEAWYGFLGAVNSTTLGDGHVLDLGGGSIQVSQVVGRGLERIVSRPLGAVRMTERFLPGARATRGDLKPLRKHVVKELADVPWIQDAGGRLVGVGGTIRTLAAMHQRATRYPLDELHGYLLPRTGIEELVDAMLELPATERSRLPGLKQDRADITLAGAVVIATALEQLGVDHVEICSQGLREGLFYERFLQPLDPPLIRGVRRQSVLNLVEVYRCDVPHAAHVCELALGIYDELARVGMHTIDRRERELLWAAGMLHDAGVTVDYNDHHKHGFYLILNSGLPGFRHAELAMIALLVRAHRKALPNPAPLEGVLDDDDVDRLQRLACCLRIAEQLERGRARGVTGVEVDAPDGELVLRVRAEGDPAVALWSAALEGPVVQRAFERRLRIEVAGG
ncbi:Ppx/GppA phosphatase family protein [Miltoncostaea oceani]|uniref:Ppx/GppA phosphatase family protein n=1 Tax=Miltoncostaea oceani TaxID=2843216 RepID=UPI001C3CBE27|nr:Ppx/GppA phosphatase family protein [Miltoncostaea oceani]